MMSTDSDTVLEVSGLCKRYARSALVSRQRGAQVLWQALKGEMPDTCALAPTEFWALRDVSARVRRGEALGVIGLNGSGKTTFLRVLSGQLLPDRGEVRIRGRVASMIDLTAGFQPGLTGRQNIYLRGAMLRRSKADLRAREAEIIEFSELGEVIDAPVDTYSAGMRMRLAFSISIAIEPHLLLIDEVLAVGDFRFRQKCLARMRELRDRCAFVLVSHNMHDISRFCDHVIVLHRGVVVFEGLPDDAIRYYQELESTSEPKPVPPNRRVTGELFRNQDVIVHAEHCWVDGDGRTVTQVVAGAPLRLRCDLVLKYLPRQFVIGVPLWTEDGVLVTAFSTEAGRCSPVLEVDKSMRFVLEVPRCSLTPGRYHSVVGIIDGSEFLYRQPNPTLEVLEGGQRYWGVVSLEHRWRQTVEIEDVEEQSPGAPAH